MSSFKDGKYYTITVEGDNNNAWYYQDDAENYHIKTYPEEHPNKQASFSTLERVIQYTHYEDLSKEQQRNIRAQHAKYNRPTPRIKESEMSEQEQYDKFNIAYEIGYSHGANGEDKINPYDHDYEKSMYYEYNRGYRAGHLISSMR